MNLFEIYRLEDLCNGTSVLPDPFVRKFRFEIIWVKKGKDSMIYCKAFGCNVKVFESSSFMEGYYISFHSEFIQPWHYMAENGAAVFFEQCFPNLSLPVTENIAVELEIIAETMRREYVNSFHQKLELLRGLLNVFVIYFYRRMAEEEETTVFTRENLICKQFMCLVKKHFNAMRKVSDYARLLCITPNYLNRSVKNISGNTASYHIQRQIILEAKKQAVHSGSNLKEIAFSLGFENLAHFSKFFKTNSGTSFSCFKKGIPDAAWRPE